MTRRLPTAAIAAAALVSLAACSSGGGGASTTPSVVAVTTNSNPVSIVISNQPPAGNPADLKSFQAKLVAFHTKYPNITVTGSEIAWDPQTFAAQLAGGQLPTVVTVPFTEPQSLITNKQAADITGALKAVGLTDKLNPSALKVAQDSSGHVFGVPVGAYALGLVYNRDLFTKAGLDPDKPPTTWDEVRAAAKTISEKTGVAGYSQMTTRNTGGWMLGAGTYSRGGALTNPDGTKAVFDDQPMKDQLSMLHDMRWTDKSMGSSFILDVQSISKDFAAGKVGMFIGTPIIYQLAVTILGMDKTSFGMGSMPQGSTPGGSMSGGAVQFVNPSATDDQKVAAVKWITFFSLDGQLDQATAVADAKVAATAGLPVGLPGLSTLTNVNTDTYLGWVKDQVNVPVKNFTGYTASVNTIKLNPEPAKKAQDVYAKLDPVVQEVLTKQDADIPSLLSSATTQVNALLGR